MVRKDLLRLPYERAIEFEKALTTVRDRADYFCVPDADMLTGNYKEDTSLAGRTLAQLRAQEKLLAARWEMHLLAREFESTGPFNKPLIEVTFLSCLDHMRDFAMAYAEFKKELADSERHV